MISSPWTVTVNVAVPVLPAASVFVQVTVVVVMAKVLSEAGVHVAAPDLARDSY